MTPGQFVTYNNNRLIIWDVLPDGTIRAIRRDGLVRAGKDFVLLPEVTGWDDKIMK